MKKGLNIYTYLLTALCILISCVSDEHTVDVINKKEEINVYLHVTTPASGLPQMNTTRAWNIADESALDEVDILVFQSVNNTYEYQYSVKAMNISSTGTNTYTFNARIIANENALKIYLVANSSNVINNLSVSDTENDVKTKIIKSYPVIGLENNLPMFGEIEFPSGLTTDEDQIPAILLRSVARVDVINNATTNFTMTSVQFYRANNRIQNIPNAVTDNAVTTPSIPSGTSNTINTDVLYINGTSSLAQLYISESAVIDQNNRRLQATCVVVGGVYGTDTDTTYYRMDFIPDGSPELFGQILRNHKYVFTISNVQGPGWTTPDEAAINNSSQFDVEIKNWDENTVGMVFDGQNYLGVSDRIINMRYLSGATDTLFVDTDLNTYSVYWLDNNGTFIKVTTLIENNTTGILTKKILIKAGRLQLTITINQSGLIFGTKTVNFYGSTNEIGTFGGGILSGTSPSRPLAMVNMMNNTSNFGTAGTVGFGGFIIGGTATYEINASLAELFDILYLTYAGNPSETSVNNIFNWLETDNRVLIIQYDNIGNTNGRVFSRLGFTPVYSSNTTAYTLAANAASEIINGPFGTLPADMTFRCLDTTHGEISLTDATTNNITPILIGGNGGVVLGINRSRGIVYCGDIDLYNSTSNGITANGTVTSNQDILMANLFAWIAYFVLKE